MKITENITQTVINIKSYSGNLPKEFKIKSSSLVANNRIKIEFTEGVYGDSGLTTAINKDDLIFTYTANGDSLISCSYESLTDINGDDVVKGASIVYVNLYLEGQSDGKGTVQLQSSCNSIFNAAGYDMRGSEKTSLFTLSAETIDFIPNLKGVSLYLDFNDENTVTDDAGTMVITDKSNNGYEFKQSNASLQPANEIATNQALNFTRGQYLDCDNPPILDDINGYSMFFVFNYTSGDDILTERVSYLGELTHNIIYWMIRPTLVYFNRWSGGNITFTTSITAGFRIVEIRYTGTIYEYYVDNVLVGSSSATSGSLMYFQRIGSSNAGQGLKDKLRNITIYNDKDSTIRTAIYNKLKAKYIDQTELSNVSRTNYLQTIPLVGVYGDSNGVGRDETTNLTPSYDYIKGDIQGYIGTTLQSIGGLPNNSIPYNADIWYSTESYAKSFGTEAPILYWGLKNNNNYAVCKVAKGGSSFQYVGDEWNKTSLLWYQYSMRYIKYLYQYLNDNMFNVEIKGIMMFIGSNDSTSATSSAAFLTNYRQFKSDLRADLNVPDLKFMSFNTVFTEPYKDDINAALATLSAEDINHLNSDYSESVPLKADEHFNADALVILGKYAFDNWFNL